MPTTRWSRRWTGAQSARLRPLQRAYNEPGGARAHRTRRPRRTPRRSLRWHVPLTRELTLALSLWSAAATPSSSVSCAMAAGRLCAPVAFARPRASRTLLPRSTNAAERPPEAPGDSLAPATGARAALAPGPAIEGRLGAIRDHWNRKNFICLGIIFHYFHRQGQKFVEHLQNLRLNLSRRANFSGPRLYRL